MFFNNLFDTRYTANIYFKKDRIYTCINNLSRKVVDNFF